MKGKLIVFEGGEGSGKSTMVNKTYNYLKDKGVDCIKSREPGGTLFGNDIRDILFNKDYSCTLDEQTKLYLFEAARREHYLNIIKPALDAGKVVLLDRFVLSALVLQNTGNTNEIDMLNDLSTNYVKIDATIILDINPKLAIDRIKSNNIMKACFVLHKLTTSSINNNAYEIIGLLLMNLESNKSPQIAKISNLIFCSGCMN